MPRFFGRIIQVAISKHRFQSGIKSIAGARAALVNSKLQVENNPAFQVHRETIEGIETLDRTVEEKRNKADKINLDTEVVGDLPPTQGGVKYLVYTPTLTFGANIAAATPFLTQFLRAGRLIYITGKVFVTPTAGATLTTIEVSLPVPSNFMTSDQLNGTLAAESAIGASIVPGLITGNVPLGTANLRFYSIDTNEHDVRFVFSYELF